MLMVSNIEGNLQFIIEETDVGVFIKSTSFKIVSIKNNFEEAIEYINRRVDNGTNPN